MENLSCTDVPIDESYRFYEYIDNYLHYINFCVGDNECNQYNNLCIFDKSRFDDKAVKLTLICKRFHYLLDKLFTPSTSLTYVKENAHLEYLNYWLNHELSLIKTDLELKTLFQHIRSRNSNNVTLIKLNGKIKDIPKKEINNMNSLFYLYDYYFKVIKATTIHEASEYYFKIYTNQCVKKYQELIEECPNVRTSFCKALCDFKKRYESINLSDDIIKDWTQKGLPSLSKYAKAQVKASKLSSDLDHSSLADTRIPERVYRTPVTSTASPERDSEGAVKPGAMPETTTYSESIIKAGSHQPNAISYLQNTLQQDSWGNTGQIETKNEDGFDTSTNKIIGTSISTVGVSSLFFLFYKVKNK
ncbi:hypothetical protein PVBG_05557 [Plasmodium vivax Brazil I]|uniref:Uncharacterized protein n=1 Tax=Plasmodium vivax (strain Brazil I) TaxID=1033975 RepID=A0A0J9T102_PLAV1|nr:hypothetical protein PVBG_05557 [Plasmodium vivax Brazil I]